MVHSLFGLTGVVIEGRVGLHPTPTRVVRGRDSHALREVAIPVGARHDVRAGGLPSLAHASLRVIGSGPDWLPAPPTPPDVRFSASGG